MKRLKRILAMLLVCCMVGSFMPLTAKAMTADETNGTVTAKQYYNVEEQNFVSGNNNWMISGILIDENDDAYVVLANSKSNLNQISPATLHIHYPVSDIPGEDEVTEKDIAVDVVENGEGKNTWIFRTEALTINYIDSQGNSAGSDTLSVKWDDGKVSSQSFVIIKFGTVEDILANFNVGFDTDTGGPQGGGAWDIGNPPEIGRPIEVKQEYEITKDVDREKIENTGVIDKSKEGTTAFEYTIKVENTSYNPTDTNVITPPVNVDYVYDYVPEGIIVDKVNGNAPVYLDPDTDPDNNPSTRTLVLENIPFTLYPTADEDGHEVFRTYTIEAHVDPAFKGGTVTNIAIMDGASLLEKQDDAVTDVESYFYVHHIYNDGAEENKNGKQMREEKIKFNDNLRDGDKFDVTTVKSAATDYEGMLKDTLYGGIFNKTVVGGQTTYTDPYVFATGENGIGFTPKVNEHYYVWEPTNKYLRPLNLAVWHVHDGGWNPVEEGVTRYHTVAGYPITAVDRKFYQEFGFVENDKTTPEEIYNTVKARQNFDETNTSELKAQYFGLTGYLGTYKTTDKFFNNNVATGETFLPYWVTLDGVKVTGIYQRNAKYSGVGTEAYRKMFTIEDIPNNNPVETYKESSTEPLMVNAMFYDDNLTHPLIPEMVGANFEAITAGNSGNIKSVKLTLDLSEFKYDRAWFDVNGEMVEAQEKDGVLCATIPHKKDAELTIVPHWSYGDKEFTGAANLLSVTKKNVEDITPVASAVAKRMSAASFRATMSLNEDSNGVIIQ